MWLTRPTILSLTPLMHLLTSATATDLLNASLLEYPKNLPIRPGIMYEGCAGEGLGIRLLM